MKFKTFTKTMCIMLVVVLYCIVFTSCKNDNSDKPHPVVTMTVKDYGVIVLELYQDVAPNTVANFVTLAKAGFYDGLTFHRVIEGFMIQGGDPDGTGGGGPGFSIKGEFSANGFENNLSHKPGVISMARATPPDSAGSQFFICTSDCSGLDGKYAAFGKVTSGLEVAYEIAKQGNNYDSSPEKPIVIESIVVDDKGGDYSHVEKLPEL